MITELWIGKAGTFDDELLFLIAHISHIYTIHISHISHMYTSHLTLIHIFIFDAIIINAL